MSFLRLFFPQIIKIPGSKYNRDITVIDYLNSTSVIVDGLIESGNIMFQIWGAGMKRLLPKSFIPETVLLLGLAGGSNAKLVNKYYPKAQITAVEIDPLMIDIGKKYFSLDKVKNMNIVIGDALDFANKFTLKDHYDLILVDCFEGKYIPKKLEDLDFVQKLKDHSRYTLINRIHWYDHKKPTMSFLSSLATRFFFIKTHTRSNLIISLV